MASASYKNLRTPYFALLEVIPNRLTLSGGKQSDAKYGHIVASDSAR